MAQTPIKKTVIGICLGLGLGLFALLTCPGCRSTPAIPDAQSQNPGFPQARIQPIEPRIDAIAGRKVLTPVRLDPPVTPVGAVDLRVTLDGVDPIDAQLLWISRTSMTPGAVTDPIAAWLQPPPIWSARTLDQLVAGAPPPGAGFWALLIDCPALAHNHELYIAGRPARVQWLSPRLGQPEANTSRLFQDRSPGLARALTNAARDPLNRWRVRLLDDRLRAPRATVIDDHQRRFDHEAIETMAEQAQWRWRLALDRVSHADPFLGAELLDRLTAIARFDDGAEAPVWPTDDAMLSALRTTLLDARATDETVIAKTTDALRRAPDITAWVIDDAGWATAPTGRTVTLIGVAERAGAPGLARARIDNSGGGADRNGPMTTLPAFGVARLAVQTPVFAPQESLSPSTASAIVIGRAEIPLPLLPLGLPVRAPGFRLGPGFLPWTLESWSSGTPIPAPTRLSFYALLHRRASSGGAWQLHVECPTPAGADPGQLRIHLGPSNAPSAIYRIDPAGLLQDQINTPLERDHVAITKTPDAWIATINIPQQFIEPGGILRLAIERFDEAGNRAAWPRSVMPWQTTPGRAALDCSAWNGLGP